MIDEAQIAEAVAAGVRAALAILGLQTPRAETAGDASPTRAVSMSGEGGGAAQVPPPALSWPSNAAEVAARMRAKPVPAPPVCPPVKVPARVPNGVKLPPVPSCDGGLTVPLSHRPGTEGVPYAPIRMPFAEIQERARRDGYVIKTTLDLHEYNKSRVRRCLQPLCPPPSGWGPGMRMP